MTAKKEPESVLRLLVYCVSIQPEKAHAPVQKIIHQRSDDEQKQQTAKAEYTN